MTVGIGNCRPIGQRVPRCLSWMGGRMGRTRPLTHTCLFYFKYFPQISGRRLRPYVACACSVRVRFMYRLLRSR